MLSIVAYDASDSDGESDLVDKETQRSSSATVATKKKSKENGDNPTDQDDFLSLGVSASVSDMLSGLPPPKKKRVKATETLFNDLALPTRLTCLTGGSASTGSNPKNQISSQKTKGPLDSDDSDVEDSTSAGSKSQGVSIDSTDSAEPLKFSNPLLCSLPKARTSFDLKKGQMMVPDSVKNKSAKSLVTRKIPQQTVRETIPNTEDTESENTALTSYFNFVEKSELTSTVGNEQNSFFFNAQSEDDTYEESYDEQQYTFNGEDSNHVQEEGASSSGSMASATSTQNLDSDVLQRLQGRRKLDNIEIRDVNASDQLQDVSIELTKALSEEPEHPSGYGMMANGAEKNDPSQKRAKSKHQLNWLVSHAKAREVQLKNQWATNRMNKRATQMKYGF